MSTLGEERPHTVVPHVDAKRMEQLNRQIEAGYGDVPPEKIPPSLKRSPRQCRLCGEKVHAKGLCNRHYLQDRRERDLELAPPDRCRVCGREPVEDEFCAEHWPNGKSFEEIPDELL